MLQQKKQQWIMTKVSIKNENIFNFGGIFHVADKFDQTIGKTIVETLGKRYSKNAVYQLDDAVIAFYKKRTYI